MDMYPNAWERLGFFQHRDILCEATPWHDQSISLDKGMRLSLRTASTSFHPILVCAVGPLCRGFRHSRPPADCSADYLSIRACHTHWVYFAPIESSSRHMLYSRLLTIHICRLLSHTIHTRILNPAFLPVVLRTLRATLFPNNALGPPRQIPSDEEAQVIKHRCAATILDLVPSKVAAAFFATYEHEKQIRQIEDTLSSLDDPYLNKHLVFQAVELIVLRLFPELGERGVKELLEEHTN
jgi:hypothetical protein